MAGLKTTGAQKGLIDRLELCKCYCELLVLPLINEFFLKHSSMDESMNETYESLLIKLVPL